MIWWNIAMCNEDKMKQIDLDVDEFVNKCIAVSMIRVWKMWGCEEYNWAVSQMLEIGDENLQSTESLTLDNLTQQIPG